MKSQSASRNQFSGSRRGSQLLEDRKIGIPVEARCGAEERDQKIQSDRADVGDVEMLCNKDSPTIGKRKRTTVQHWFCSLRKHGHDACRAAFQKWKQMHVRGIEGISCQHLQVMMKQLLPNHQEWQEYRRKNVLRGSEKDPRCTSPARHQDG